MRLSADDLETLADCAVIAAQEAGTLIAKYNGSEVAVQYKTGGENLASQVVTEVDELSQSIVLKHLLPTCATYDLADAFWCVDPLDGTLSFTESIPGYSVSIALVACDGTPLIGVVYDPVKGISYRAVRGQGVLRDGVVWKLGKRKPALPLQFISDRSVVQQPQYENAIERLRASVKELGCNGFEMILRGGGVMNAIWVLERAPACYFKFPKPQAGGGSLWDFAATACLYTELGAWCSDCAGRSLELNRTDSTFMNHRGVLFASDRSLGQQLRTVLACES
jgi:3'(2'), 5'-bisphosphate nucleotidase/myo-inositol-1(or 4)-monophosphatase